MQALRFTPSGRTPSQAISGRGFALPAGTLRAPPVRRFRGYLAAHVRTPHPGQRRAGARRPHARRAERGRRHRRSPPAPASSGPRPRASPTSPSTCSSRAPSGAPPRATSRARSTASAASSTPSPARSSPAYYVKCAAELRARRGRRPRRHAAALALRRGGARAREGRHRRGDQHVPRHAARPHRAGLGRGALGRHAARPGRSSAARRPSSAPTATRSCSTSASWYRPERAGRSGSAARSTTRCWTTSPTRFGGLENVADAAAARDRAAARTPGPRVRVERRESDQAHIVLGARRPAARASRPLRRRASCRRVLGGGMSSRLFTEVRERRGLAYYVFASHAAYTDAGSLVVRGGRRHRARRARGRDHRDGAAAHRGRARRRRTSSARRSATSPAGSCSASRSRAARSCSACGACCWRGAPAELDEVVAGIEAVTADGRAAPGRRADPPRADDAGRDRPARGGAAPRGPGRRGVAPAAPAWIPRAADRLPGMDADRLVARHRAHLRELLPPDTWIGDAHTHLGLDEDGMRLDLRVPRSR